jgi:hypothetical protein
MIGCFFCLSVHFTQKTPGNHGERTEYSTDYVVLARTSQETTIKLTMSAVTKVVTHMWYYLSRTEGKEKTSDDKLMRIIYGD